MNGDRQPPMSRRTPTRSFTPNAIASRSAYTMPWYVGSGLAKPGKIGCPSRVTVQSKVPPSMAMPPMPVELPV